jgi:hypothetical protein
MCCFSGNPMLYNQNLIMGSEQYYTIAIRCISAGKGVAFASG